MSPFFYALMWFSFGALLMRALVMWLRVAPLERDLKIACQIIGEQKQMELDREKDAVVPS